MREIRVSAAAEQDLLEIWDYIAESSESTADRLIDEIADKYEALIDFPEMGRSRDEIAYNCRSLNAGKYLIFYRLIPQGIEIARVIHGSRNLADIL
jgi:toxin ParE1/3/4